MRRESRLLPVAALTVLATGLTTHACAAQTPPGSASSPTATPASQAGASDGLAPLTATGRGEGKTEDEALRAAVGEALKTLMAGDEADSKGQETRWIRELVKAHPRHIIPDSCRTILSRKTPQQNKATGTWSMEVRVQVPPARFAEARAEAADFYRNTLSGMSPTVSIFFVDRIEENGSVWPYSRVTEHNKESHAAHQIDEALNNDLGFRVIVASQSEVLRKIHEEFASLNSLDTKEVQAIAREQGAQIFVVGGAHVIGPEADTRHVPGTTSWRWKATAYARIFWTDTGEQIATLDASDFAFESNQDAGRLDGLRKVGSKLAPKLMAELFKKWSVCAFEGRVVTLTVEHADARQLQEILQILKQRLGKPVRPTFTNGVAALELGNIKGTTDQLAFDLASQKFSTFDKLEIERVEFHTARFIVKN